jgi:hypothetical protein
MNGNLNLYKEERAKQAKRMFFYLRVCLKFRVRCRRFGPDRVTTINTNKIKYSFSVYGNVAVRQIVFKQGKFYNQMAQTLKSFFASYFWELMTAQMIRKTRYFNMLVGYMQKRMRAKCVTGDAKMHIVKSHWDNMLF